MGVCVWEMESVAHCVCVCVCERERERGGGCRICVRACKLVC